MQRTVVSYIISRRSPAALCFPSRSHNLASTERGMVRGTHRLQPYPPLLPSGVLDANVYLRQQKIAGPPPGARARFMKMRNARTGAKRLGMKEGRGAEE
jgi:hypothetical protein